MKKSELIKQLELIPGDPEVAILDHKKNLLDDCGDGSTLGIYKDIEVAPMNEDAIPEGATPWLALSFDNPDETIEPSIYRKSDEPIHQWFELTYAQYLTVPRSVMQAMPREWQIRMAECLRELDNTIDWRPQKGSYWVKLKDDKGRYVEDPLMNYRRPNREAIVFKDPSFVHGILYKNNQL